MLAARSLGSDATSERVLVEGLVNEYANWLSELSELSALDVWHARVDADDVSREIKNRALRRTAEHVVDKARHRTHLQSLDKMTPAAAAASEAPNPRR